MGTMKVLYHSRNGQVLVDLPCPATFRDAENLGSRTEPGNDYGSWVVTTYRLGNRIYELWRWMAVAPYTWSEVKVILKEVKQ